MLCHFSALSNTSLQRLPSLVCMLFVCRHLVHVHDCWAVYVEVVSEETPRHQCKCLHCLRLPGSGHLLFCTGSGAFYTLLTFWRVDSVPAYQHFECLQVFGKGNMVFWIVFSVIHILATLLLSTQLYYMGRWRLGKITTLKNILPKI